MKLYFFKLNGCSHCETMKTLLDKIKLMYDIPMQEIEHNNKNKLSSRIQKQLDIVNINAYPELKLINKLTNQVYTFSGPRTVDDIWKWIKQNSVNIKQSFTHKKKYRRSNNSKIFGGFYYPRHRSNNRRRPKHNTRRHY